MVRSHPRDELLGLGVVAHSFFTEQALDGNPKELPRCEAQQAYALLMLPLCQDS